MANIAIYKIQFKSDFVLTIHGDAGWATPFCIKFWTGAPSQAYFVGWDGKEYINCKVDDTDASKLIVLFDDHQLPVGQLKMQMAWHTTIADFPNARFDDVMNQMDVVATVDGEEKYVELAFEGEADPEVEYFLPAYANEAQRIANEEQRIAHEAIRIVNEESRIAAETIRQQHEAQRISNEESRVEEFAQLKQASETATADANAAATLANEKAALAADKAALADDAATLANAKAQLAADKAALADAAATLANDKAALAQQKAEYAQTQGDYAKAKGDICADDHLVAVSDHQTAIVDHQTAAVDHQTAADDHTLAGTDHQTAVADHQTAADDHQTASTDHSTAESDHTRAESDHTTASADHTQAGQDHTRAESDHTRAESDHAVVEVYVDSLGAFDISAYHATGGVLAKYADLAAALGTNGANIPEAIRKGGMSVKFVLSSDNKYVQYRLLTDTFSTNVDDWEQAASVAQLEELEDNVVMTGSYDASVAVGLADNLRGDAIVSAEFYKRKTGGTQSVGSGIAAIKEVRGKSIVWNQLVDANTAEVTTVNNQKYLTVIGGVKSIITSIGDAITISDASVDQVFNLTLMFGKDYEPSSVADFEKMFPLDYYDYNAGEIIPFAGQNLVTTGKNQYNPTSGKANLLGGQTYQLLGTYTGATIEEVAVTLDSNNCFTTTKDCVLDITGGNDTDTIVALYNGENVTYEPYEKHTLPLDPSQWRDKQGNLVFPYGGMYGSSNVYDYAKMDADGYIRKVVKTHDVIDLGTLTPNIYQSQYKRVLMYRTQIPTMGRRGRAFCVKYASTENVDRAYGCVNVIDATWFIVSTTDAQGNFYDSGTAWKSAMQGVMLYYPLAEPVEVELATPVYAKYLVDKDGTEEITPANGQEPYTTPANLSILYAMDARGEIKNLPKNYLSKESAENMLNAMVSAGVIASYTMTYDAANARYQFAFVKAEEAQTNQLVMNQISK